MLYEIPKDKYPVMGKKAEKLRICKTYPFYQPIRGHHSYLRWSYANNHTIKYLNVPKLNDIFGICRW